MNVRNLTLVALMLILCVSLGVADNLIYANNATGGAPYVYKIDKTTGAVLDTYTNLSSNNGRGVVVVGDTMYYTAANSGSVFSYTLSTHTNNGALFGVSGASGLSTIAYDGTNFWIGDYSGTNKAYLYSATGTLLKTVTLANCSGNCDGLEYLAANGGELLSNRFDGGFGGTNTYDLYNTNGVLVQSAFITASQCSPLDATGVAFDGTYYFVSCLRSGTLAKYDINGQYVGTITLSGYTISPLIEDISADYSQVLPPTNAPEPASLLLMGAGLASLIGWQRRKSHK